jgi:hypothetical protein
VFCLHTHYLFAKVPFVRLAETFFIIRAIHHTALQIADNLRNAAVTEKRKKCGGLHLSLLY